MNASGLTLAATTTTASAISGTPPEHLFSDYVEMAYLAVMIVIGIPSNLAVLSEIRSQLRAMSTDNIKAGFMTLKLHVTISDLLLLSIMALGKLLWLVTYQWRGGDALCRVFHYLLMASLYLSSNIVVAISLDRLRTVLAANKVRRRARGKTLSFRLLLCAVWALSLLWALPQLAVRRCVVVYDDFTQCTDVWAIHRHLDEQAAEQGTSLSGPSIANDWILSNNTKIIYNISHLVLVFWGPLLVLLVSYATIAMRLARFSLQAPTQCQEALEHAVRVSIEPASFDVNSRNNVISDEERSVVYVQKKQSRMNLATFWAARTNAFAHSKLIYRHSPSPSTASPAAPAWRRRLRGKLFRSTLLIVVAHFLIWLPYNVLALVQYVDQPLFRMLSDHTNVMNDLQLLITIINPFLYTVSK